MAFFPPVSKRVGLLNLDFIRVKKNLLQQLRPPTRNTAKSTVTLSSCVTNPQKNGPSDINQYSRPVLARLPSTEEAEKTRQDRVHSPNAENCCG